MAEAFDLGRQLGNVQEQLRQRPETERGSSTDDALRKGARSIGEGIAKRFRGRNGSADRSGGGGSGTRAYTR